MDKSTHEVRKQEWFKIIQACNSSGQSKKQWCKENSVSERQVYYWQQKIRKDLYREVKKKQEDSNSPAANEGMTVPVALPLVELPLTGITQSETFKADAVIQAGNISVQLANTASGELLEKLSRILLNNAV